ncbi:MAG: M1 family peptidase [Chryseobacterium sp.]|nr:MAG: M1 family peptidase [Chryseobacterium sp.]
MKKLFSIAMLVVLGSYQLSAQELYMPRNIKAAYQKGTRSMNGNPGANYWQNHGRYTMDIKVDAESKVVSGQEEIVYSNNSSDTLKTLAIRFVNNLHKPTSPRGGAVSEDFLTTGLNISSFSVDGETYKVDSKNWGTVGNVRLKKPLNPKSKTTVKISWDYPLSKESGREGQIDPNSFFVAYSYPRISVYDDYNGWDRIPHTDRAEFYNDFNDYVFSVKAPKNYVVYATGDFLNPDEVLQPEISSRLKKSYNTDGVVNIATEDELKNGKVTAQKDWNTWKFKADHIPDVTFALSNHYVWDGGSVIVDAKTGRRASAQAAYNPTTGKDFLNSVKYNINALAWFSNNWPGIPYPYAKSIAFQGFADMEYPMMVNDSNFGDPVFAQLVQDHEVAHTYFPFFMGINETRYAYMDEGWATTFEYLIGIAEHGKQAADNFYKKFRVNSYINDKSAEEDQPVISMSDQVSGAGYGNNSYGKASLSYLALKDMLGDDLFKKALHHYMNTWNGKHPIPWDYFNSMNTGSGQNLNWFFQNWFFTNNYLDLAIGKTEISSGKATFVIKNVGGFAIPFDILVTDMEGKTETIHKTPAVWKVNQKEFTMTITTNRKIKSIALDNGIYVDATPNDNVYTVR